MRHGESFHPSLFSFLFDWWMKRWEIAEELSMNCTAFIYYIMLMAKRTCAWLHHLLKLLLSTWLSCIDSSQPGWFQSCWDLYACSWAVICPYNWCYQASTTIGRSFHHVLIHRLATKYITFYAWTNRLTHFSACDLPIQLLLCVNKRLKTSIIKY